ncbi:hypothetical protein KL86DES1_21249 [uncultured Desulfovibrio sp.]|uniref:Uncharacterized protein n=1 Tax=uncultured Desulfovibrio sp. TaxID=167968 RepID=A0A212L743_9BACT|nr:hypothetical protein KL86DES1_21249 [uncultured Desulfovibrio sp.]VZH34144.1 conserved protein of unknown function [Desulfovibrio sp. 86]
MKQHDSMPLYCALHIRADELWEHTFAKFKAHSLGRLTAQITIRCKNFHENPYLVVTVFHSLTALASASPVFCGTVNGA